MTQNELMIHLHRYSSWELLHLENMGNTKNNKDSSALSEEMIGNNSIDIGLHFPSIPDQKEGVYSEMQFFHSPSDKDILIVQHDRYTPPLIHKHDFFELMYVYEGEFTQQIGSANLLMHTGDFCLIAPNVFHALNVYNYSIVLNILIRKNKFKDMVFQELKADKAFASLFSQNTYSENPDNYVLFHTNGDNKIRSLILDMCLEQINREEYYEYMLNADLQLLFGLLLRGYGHTCAVPQPKNKNDNENFSILQYIEQNFQSLTLKELATHFHYSPQYMSGRLKQITGMSFSKYLLDKKMQVAANLLTTTNMKIKTISEKAGYPNQEHFIRTFRNYYGTTPGVYRSTSQIHGARNHQ